MKNGFVFKPLDPSKIQWNRISKYFPIVQKVNNLKIGEGLEVINHNPFAKHVGTNIRQVSYKAVKGVYRIKTKLSNDKKSLYITKTEK